MKRQNARNDKRKSFLKKGTAVAAAAMILTAGSLGAMQTNQVHAASAPNFLKGMLTRVFTVVDVQKKDAVANVSLKIPAVEGLKDSAYEAKINAQIKEKMETVAAKAKAQAAEDKEAWLKTGGTEAEYTPKEIAVDYQVKSVSDEIVSFLIFETESGASCYENQYYYNIDLKNSKDVTLEQLLGKDYINLANAQVKAEIAKRSQQPDSVFYDGSEGVDGFQSISADQSFYVNKAGKPVIVFNKYEIAPGFMGVQEFEITK